MEVTHNYWFLVLELYSYYIHIYLSFIISYLSHIYHLYSFKPYFQSHHHMFSPSSFMWSMLSRGTTNCDDMAPGTTIPHHTSTTVTTLHFLHYFLVLSVLHPLPLPRINSIQPFLCALLICVQWLAVHRARWQRSAGAHEI